MSSPHITNNAIYCTLGAREEKNKSISDQGRTRISRVFSIDMKRFLKGNTSTVLLWIYSLLHIRNFRFDAGYVVSLGYSEVPERVNS